MRVAVFSSKPYDERYLNAANEDHGHDLRFLEPRLTAETARLAEGHDAVCVFVNDQVNADVIRQLAEAGIRVIATRSAGFNHIDLRAADEHQVPVVRVPAYSPHGVAEHTMALILTLNRKIHRAAARVREFNFSLEGLQGFDMFGRTVGIVGTGKIGTRVAHILNGFGCRLLGFDKYPNDECRGLGLAYVELDELLRESDIITLHAPLTPETHHLINADTLEQVKPGAMLVNTSRGGLIDTPAAVEALKSGQLGSLGLDVYEEESDLFFENLSNQVIQDDVFARLLTFPNVVVTSHQAFFTREALTRIAEATLGNLTHIERGEPCENTVEPAKAMR